MPNLYGIQRFFARCGEREWPLFTYFKRNRHYFSSHRVACRVEDGDALWCDVLSDGADPARRVDIRVADDAPACAGGSER